MKNKTWVSKFNALLCAVLTIVFLANTVGPISFARAEVVEDENIEVTTITLSEDETLFVDGEGNRILHNNKSGMLYYFYEGEYLPIDIVNVSEDGVIEWKIDGTDLAGFIDSNGTATMQMSIAIPVGVGTGGAITVFLGFVLKVVAVVVIAGLICYVADYAAKAIRKASRHANYFPAFLVFKNVYVATGVGLSEGKAVTRIRLGLSVWAVSKSRAKTACIKASPIRRAEYGWHGSIKKGYYPHYHAVKRYNRNGTYVHTGAHCWFPP